MAKRAGLRIDIPEEFERWVAGLQAVELDMSAAMKWEQAAEYMFSETQRLVHILSGDLKASGKVLRGTVGGMVVTTGIDYGMEYAIYEIARGGNHDFIGPALTRAERVFKETVIEIGIDMVTKAVT